MTEEAAVATSDADYDWDAGIERLGASPEAAQRDFVDLPHGAWIIADTVADPQQEWACPQVQTKEWEERTYFKFGASHRTVGGDKLCKPEEHRGRYASFSTGIEPLPACGEHWDKGKGGPNAECDACAVAGRKILSGKMMGFVNACFASGVGGPASKDKAKDAVRTKERGRATGAVFKAAAQAASLTPGQYVTEGKTEPNETLFYAGCAVAALMASPKRVLAKVSLRAYCPSSGCNKKKWLADGTCADCGSEKRVSVETSTIEDATEANIKARKIVLFPDSGEAATGAADEIPF